MIIATKLRKSSPIELHVARHMELILRESPREALKLSAQWQYRREQSRQHWRFAADTTSNALLEKTSLIAMQDEVTLVNYLRNTNTGIVLTTIHMGSYLYSIFRIVSQLKGRKLVILRRKEQTDQETNVFRKLQSCGLRVEVVRHGTTSAMRVLQCIRRGGIAIILYDLSQQWGETRPVTVLDKTMHWVIGPAQLAYQGRAQLVPFYSHYDEAENPICVIDKVHDLSDTSLQISVVDEIAQKLASLAGEEIRRHPAQWQQWNLVSDMLIGPKHA